MQADRSTRNVALIEATPREIYRAFLDPELLAAWLAPDEMTLSVHTFDAREGGEFRMSLAYPAGEGGAGKTTADMDAYHGHFAELVPDRRIVEVIEFETDDPGFAGEMRMTVTLAATRQGTYVTIDFDGIPPGIALADNEEGTASSLEKLSGLVGRTAC
jgi:uncharacterized protein YndB with AHSA1/START domain